MEIPRMSYRYRCRRDDSALRERLLALARETWMDIGAGIWNRSQKMRTVRMVASDDMRKILAYVWQLQFDGPPGNRVRGQKALLPGAHFVRTVPRVLTIECGISRRKHVIYFVTFNEDRTTGWRASVGMLEAGEGAGRHNGCTGFAKPSGSEGRVG
jgi:hypothetical protein